MVALGKVCQYSKNRVGAKSLNSENYVGVDNLLPNKQGKKSSDYVPIEGNLIAYELGDILIGNIRPYLKKIWLADNRGGTNGDVLVFQIKKEYKDKLLSKYLYYVLSSDLFFTYNTQHSKGAKMPRGDKVANMKYEFLLPPLEIQQVIVDILDKFDMLVNDLNTGLPAEINARRQQYEYYRNKLLTFKECKNDFNV
ncbi:restriction endonuclease subunit S [Rodentibacter trehalosifermentans]|uniref:Restriction endonuclease subunit S n=2 Tax=Rodentibacter trehalosifermentans TaxID=1908263 RepID=A0A1V3IVS9_9PAST|nr:restriction endonuclease subunit S [Rodentibacter trehalosifermentans]